LVHRESSFSASQTTPAAAKAGSAARECVRRRSGFVHVGIRRRRITLEERSGILADLEDLPILIDRETSDRAWRETLALADKHNLTVYDATYLELSLRLSLPFATLDDDLRNAAQHEGVPLLRK
jgi:predicted nucleic acid-binding protein